MLNLNRIEQPHFEFAPSAVAVTVVAVDEFESQDSKSIPVGVTVKPVLFVTLPLMIRLVKVMGTPVQPEMMYSVNPLKTVKASSMGYLKVWSPLSAATVPSE
jgi:hypothetical protein